MTLDSQQAQKLQDWVRSKGVSPPCPVCGAINWIPGDVIAAPVMTSEGLQRGGAVVPMVQLVCGNCAYVLLFAAVSMDLP